MTSKKVFGLALALAFSWACSSDAVVEVPGPDAGSDMGLRDATVDDGTPDAALDAGAIDAGALDAAATDAPPDDATTSDAGLEPRVIYTLMSGDLVRVNLDTGAHESIAETGYTFLSFAWDTTALVARVIYDINTPGSSTAKLGTIDLCTGVVTPGVTLHIGATDLTYAEAFAQDPATGTFWLSYPTLGAGNQYATNRIGTVDVTTGEVTFVGTVDTVENDTDSMTFVDGAVIFVDVARSMTTSEVFRATPPTSGTAMTQELIVRADTDAITRIAYDAANDEVLVLNSATGLADRHAAVLNRVTGETTRLTPALAASEFPGAFYYAMLVAPPPTCP